MGHIVRYEDRQFGRGEALDEGEVEVRGWKNPEYVWHPAVFDAMHLLMMQESFDNGIFQVRMNNEIGWIFEGGDMHLKETWLWARWLAINEEQ